MSGFAGIIRLEPSLESAEVDRATIARMAQAIAFRGPDAQQQWSQNGASFAFSLLTTGPAPQAASQPVTLDGNTWLLGDVRLDRRKELLCALTAAECGLTPNATDEEITLAAWTLWRERDNAQIFFEELRGEFSFAIWEPNKRELNCFRDVIGCRPFYYVFTDGVFSYSNTLDALRHAPGFSGDLDREYIADFLLLASCPRPERTVYSKARRLPAGHQIRVSMQGLVLRRYQQLPIEEPLFLRHEEDYVATYRDLLEKAVADRLPRCAAAIFLSGGLDSSSVAATAAALLKGSGAKNDLHGVTADMKPLFEDEEGQWARRVAEHLGISFELSHQGQLVPFGGLENSRALFPEPMANPFRAVYLHLYRQSAARARVVFFGYGGDDVLAGQTGAYLAFMTKRWRLGQALAELASYTARQGQLPPLRIGMRAKLRNWFGLRREIPGPPPWFAEQFARDLQPRDRWQELHRQPPALHPVHPKGFEGLAGGWAEILDKEDAAYNGLPLDVRLPLFDYRLVRFLLRLPTLPWCANKEIARRAMRNRLPESILRRPKRILARDPLQLHEKRGNWRPQSFGTPAEEMREFVDWPKFLERGRYQRVADLWADCTPLGLNLWLKNR